MYGLGIHDRVMQIENKELRAYDFEAIDPKTRKRGAYIKQYVPNGQLGFVSPVRRDDFNRFNKKAPIRFGPDYQRYKFEMTERACAENLAFAYGLSVHKSQGSQFRTVIAVIPSRETDFLSRELMYTLLTRAQGRLILLLEADARIVLSRTWGGYSELLRRNSAVFRTARGWRTSDLSKFRTDTLINQALPELFVRSAGEALISRTLAALEIDFYYEKPLDGKDGGQPRRPDFTFRKSGQDWYLEHLVAYELSVCMR